jgi:hypothetical protein
MKTQQERLETALDAALRMISKLPLAYFEGDYIPKPTVDNYLQLVRGEFWEDEKMWRKLNAMIDGMLFLQEHLVKEIEEAKCN